MNHPRFRITILTMLVLVACAGFSFAAFRVHPIFGLLIAIAGLAGTYRAFAIGDLTREEGKPLSAWDLFKIHAGLILIVVSFEAVSIAFGTAIYAILSARVPPWHRHATLERIVTHLSLIALSMTLGVYAAFRLYQHFWPSRWTGQAPRHPITGRDSVDLERGPQ